MKKRMGRTIRTASARPLFAFSVVLLEVCFAACAGATTFFVNSITDAVDAALGNGVCATATGECTLRAAVQEANALAGADTINVPAGNYFLILQGPNENAASTGDLDLKGELTINGTGASFPVIGGSGIDRVFDIQANAVVTLSRLTMQNGSPSGTSVAGGGLRNAGALTLLDVSVRNNTVQNGDGGGIGNLSSGRMLLTNVTVSGNVAADRGGGIANDVGGTMQLVNVTITDNGAFTGGDIDNLGDAELVNTIVANSRQSTNCTGLVFLSLGHNIDDGESCGLIAPGDLTDTNPGLGQPSSATFAYPLVPGSPAIDAGDNNHCPDTDQRGAGRPADGNMDGGFDCDIGAYEASGPLAATPTPSPTASATAETATPTLTATATPTTQTATPGGAAIRLSTATGSPGDRVIFSATLETGGNIIGSAQNDIDFDSENIPIAALPAGDPDCTLNPEIAKQPLFVFRPPGCQDGNCVTLRAAALPSFPVIPIADGSILYTCAVAISPGAPTGEYALTIKRVALSTPEGMPITSAVGFDGSIIVALQPTATPTPTVTDTPTQTATPIPCIGDCDRDGQVTIAEIITMVNIALGSSPLTDCAVGDANHDGVITVDEILAAVDNSLKGCPGARSTR
jgi:CSLREA domain-containing protein